ncbi:MAG: citrate synthase [Phycisphaerae bacterium]|nr:Citrate synthase [Phycisphaerales bacterium]MCK6476255.1 citrate synthase [Phycisphaerales bacterium]
MANYSKGLEGVIAAETKLSFIDGEKGVLEYLGIPIGELATYSTFEETVFLLWNGRLPTKAELESFNAEIRKRYDLGKEVARMVLDMPQTAEPMHVIRTLVSALGLYDPKPNAIDLASVRDKALTVLAQTPTMLAYFQHHRKGTPIVLPDRNLGLAENFLYMLNGKRPTPTMAKALDVCLVLHTDHGLNNSTFSARSVISTESDLYSALTAAIGSLRGPLHGGANEGVMKMLNQIPSVDAAEAFIQDKLAKKEKIPGFGHRVYKSYDPRAKHLKVLAKQLAEDTGNAGLYEKSARIEAVMEREKAAKGIYPNVDFYSATTYHCIGLPLDLFTPMFVVGRVGGWSAHILEQLADNRLYRPDVDYKGPHAVSYTPIEKR